jgi:predicted dehydrogenase
VSTHAGAYSRTPGIELTALCDIDGDKLNRYTEKYRVPGRYSDFVQMLDRESLDILSVCTLSETHLEIVRAGVERNVKAIFCEKPIAQSLEAADEMIRLCAERDVILMIDHQRRFDPSHQQIANFLHGGGLGRIQQVSCFYTAGVANTGTHLFDLLRFYLGEIAWVEGRMSANPSANAADPNIDGWLGFSDGSSAAIQACDDASYTIFEIHLLGTKGRLRVTSHGFGAEYEEVRDSKRFSGYRELFSAPSPVPFDTTHEFMLCAVAHLRDCLTRGERPVSSGQDGRAALEIVCALSQSAVECGKRVELPLADASIRVSSR